MKFYFGLLLIGFGLPFTLHATPITGTTASLQTTPTITQQRLKEDQEVIKHLDILENMDMYEHMDMYEYMNVFEQEDKK
jgi:hypothetical protein